jgi:outer membrane receptor protein involved in Fe transport
VRAVWRHQRSGFTANLRGIFLSEWVAARATVGGQRVDTMAPGYAVWDSFASQRIVRGVTAFVAVDNLADNQDPNFGQVSATGAPLAIYRPDVGRTVRGGIRWSWSAR